MSGSSFVPTSPRQRRLDSDNRRLELLVADSSIFSFKVVHPRPTVGPPETYRIRFRGLGLQYIPSVTGGSVEPVYDHEVLIQLVAEYPRSAPHMRWMTPIFHPNISASGAICLGGWGTHWAPSLHLDRLCEMLWDMMRFANYDTRSPFNQQAANWLRTQRKYRFPLDQRELRDNPQIYEAVAVSPPKSTDCNIQADTSRQEPDRSASLMNFGSPVHHLSRSNRSSSGATRAEQSTNHPHSQPDILFLD